MTEIYVDDRKGNVLKIPHGKVTLQDARSGRAGSMEFEYYGTDPFSSTVPVENGMIVRMYEGKEARFYGFVFKVGKTKITCYDQIRYLKFKDTKVFKEKKASEVLETIVRENELSLGSVADTGHVIPSQIYDQVEYLDMISKGLQSTLMATGRLYVLRDAVGDIELLDIEDTKLDLVIDGHGNMTSYDYTKSIDKDTYNRIKLVKDNKAIGARDVYVYEDKNSISNWGKLQYYELVNEKLNEAQIKERGEALMTLRNRERKTLSIKGAIGDSRCVSGYSVVVSIPEKGILDRYLIDRATHVFDQNAHTMDLELVVY